MYKHYRDIYVCDTKYGYKAKRHYCTCSSRFMFLLNLKTKLMVMMFNDTFKKEYKHDHIWYDFEFVEYSMNK